MNERPEKRRRSKIDAQRGRSEIVQDKEREEKSERTEDNKHKLRGSCCEICVFFSLSFFQDTKNFCNSGLFPSDSLFLRTPGQETFLTSSVHSDSVQLISAESVTENAHLTFFLFCSLVLSFASAHPLRRNQKE